MDRHSSLALLVALVAAAVVVDLPAPCHAFFQSASPTSSSSSSSRRSTRCKRNPTSSATLFPAGLVKKMSSLTTAAAAAGPASGVDATSTTSNGEEATKRRAIVVVGLNGALQRTIVFKPPKGLHVGHVNRASSVGAGIGGKGQNVCVALRKLEEGGGDAEGAAQEEGGAVDVTLAHFAGGKSGEQRPANALLRVWVVQVFCVCVMLTLPVCAYEGACSAAAGWRHDLLVGQAVQNHRATQQDM